MLKKASMICLSFLCLSPLAQGKNKPKAPCRIFFQIGEKDPSTNGKVSWGFNEDQWYWWIGYEDKGKGKGFFRGHQDEGKYSGICWLGGEAPQDAIRRDSLVFSIVWGWYLSDPYLIEGTTHRDTYYSAEISVGRNDLQGFHHWGDAMPYVVSDRTDFLSNLQSGFHDPSVQILKHALNMIVQAEKDAQKHRPWEEQR